MRSRLDDELLDHQKIFDAGTLLGKNGSGLALAIYVLGILYANRHLTDGYLSAAVVKSFPHIDDPLRVADALTKVALFEKVNGGFKIHDFSHYNPSAAEIRRKRREDRERKAADAR